MSCINILGCIKTEWFDVDDPCLTGDYESHFNSMRHIVPYKKTRRFRNCLEEYKGGWECYLKLHPNLINIEIFFVS